MGLYNEEESDSDPDGLFAEKENSDDAKMESNSDHDGLLADDEHRMALQCYFLPETSSNRE